MKILRLEIEGFRSLRDECWEPGDLNVVIGPNGSGKSNLLAGAGVAGLLSDRPAGRYVQREGGMEPLLWDGRADLIRLVVRRLACRPTRTRKAIA